MAPLVIRSAGSGEVLAEFDEDEFQKMVEARGNMVKALKLKLHQKGFGTRFQLRILIDSAEMQDDEICVPPLDLRLVKMSLLSDKGKNQMFIEACGEGNLEEVEFRLKNLQDPNAQLKRLLFSRGDGLHFAAMNGHLEVFRLLLESSASCHQTTFTGKTSLHAANGHLEVARLLLQSSDVAMAKLPCFSPERDHLWLACSWKLEPPVIKQQG